jgi:hypothetical protein
VVNGRAREVVRWKVKYRFVEGAPEADALYECQVDFSTGGVALAEMPGRDMKAEGTFEQETVFPDPNRVPESLTMIVRRKGAGGRLTRSNEVTCPVGPNPDS